MSERELPEGLPDWIAEHIRLYREDPEKGHMWDSSALGGPGVLPTLLLTTRGRKSGDPRTLPLIYGAVDGGYAIIASKGGFPTHPAWYLNLVDEPECDVQVGTDEFRARARTAEGDEREAIWVQMEAIYPPYRDYQAATDRRIPVVVLERI
jgi:deazaflavin-dependent oxidoreductase (nitroreductase family)